jgi:hypothetical protein
MILSGWGLLLLLPRTLLLQFWRNLLSLIRLSQRFQRNLLPLIHLSQWSLLLLLPNLLWRRLICVPNVVSQPILIRSTAASNAKRLGKAV